MREAILRYLEQRHVSTWPPRFFNLTSESQRQLAADWLESLIAEITATQVEQLDADMVQTLPHPITLSDLQPGAGCLQ